MKTESVLPVTQLLAEFVAALRSDALPDKVRTEAKLAIADTIAGALAGHSEPVAKVVLALTEGDAGTHRIWGSKRTTSPRNAALVNGTLAHAHDIDDTNPSMRGHPSCPVVPAIFALAPLAQADGKTLIAAYVAGVEVATKLGRA